MTNWPLEPDRVMLARGYDVITNGEDHHGKAWRVHGYGKWVSGRGSFAPGCVPHPDADKVWADYCAALLRDDIERVGPLL